MKHRFLITALAFGMLTGAVSTTIVPTQPVQAISKKVAVNHGYRKVTIVVETAPVSIPKANAVIKNLCFIICSN